MECAREIPAASEDGWPAHGEPPLRESADAAGSCAGDVPSPVGLGRRAAPGDGRIGHSPYTAAGETIVPTMPGEHSEGTEEADFDQLEASMAEEADALRDALTDGLAEELGD